MALSTYALVSLKELNYSLGEDPDNGPIDESKENLINRVSVNIETFLDRLIVTRGSLTEYHSPRCGQTELLLGEWPVTAVTSVHEDLTWAGVALASRYPSTTLLVADTDYLVIKPTREPAPFGKLLRLFGSWAAGRRVIKVVYTAGYTDTASVPNALKDTCLDWCKALWWEESRRKTGLQSVSDAAGNVTRMAPTILTEARRSALMPYSRAARSPGAGGVETWERDAA